MSRWWPLAGAVLLTVGGVAGCSGGSAAGGVRTGKSAAPVASADVVTGDGDAAQAPAAAPQTGTDRFVSAVEKQLPDVAMDRRDDEITDLGQTACDALHGGKSPAAAVKAVEQYGVTASDAGKFVTLAKGTYCGK